MVLNAAVQILGETEELKQKISNFKSGVCMLQEPGQWVLQQQLQKIYQKVLLMDLDYALEKKVEQDLWNIGFKQQIEALQAITKDRKNAQRSEGQAMLACVLQAAAGFYLCLLHQICTTFKLDLPFRRRASLLGLVEGWGAAAGVGPAQPARRPPAAAVRYATQHCLVHLGDLARYRQQLAVACSFYRHALMVSAHSGQPYNQLALVWTRRGRRLSALYWHVRSLLVRAPFPPAASNLQRALNATASECLPVVPGVSRGQSGGGGGGTGAEGGGRATSPAARRLDSPALVDELLRVLRDIYNHDELENAERAVATLNTSLSALIATDSLDTSTLIKMACLIIWLVEWATEKYTLESDAMSEAEVKAVKLSYDLAAGVILAHLLPTYTADEPHENALPSLKVWLSWLTCAAGALRHESWGARGALWAALAHTLACLAPLAPLAPLTDTADCQDYKRYETLPLPEDIELHGFLPIEGALSGIRFPDQVTWDTYGDRIPEPSDDSETDLDSVRCPLDSLTLSEQPTLARAARARRLLALGQNIADQRPDLLTYTIEDGKLKFTSPCPCGEPLPAAMLELSPPSPPPPPPPLVISEADFREKVREKRVGILKPQGSLERAREERLAGQHSEQAPAAEAEAEEGRGEEARREKKTRMNVAMAAIMRKQEETNKQVKFVTPPATPDSTSEVADAPPKDNGDKPKLVEPKPTKSLANIPVGRKTGGILSLKDKSAGYPHLVNAEPEPKPKPKEEKENKPAPKSQEHPPAGKWPYGETHRHAYGAQGGAPGYTGHGGPGIRLPVVNPKEIDVRSAALLKQSGRMELDPRPAPLDPRPAPPDPRDPRDRRALFADLPPRFANQYRYWHSSQDNHYHTHENKFRDDNFNQQNSALFGNQPRNWAVNPNPAQEVPPWYKPADNQNFSNPNFGQAMGVQGNFYSPLSSVSNPYRAPQYPAAPAPPAPPAPHAPNKPDGGFAHNFMQPPPLHNLMPSPNFNTLNFGSYTPAVTYDSAMYPQFNKMFPPPQLKAPEKQYGAGGGLHGGVGVAGGADTGFGGNVLDMQRNTLKYSEPPAASEAAKALEQSSGNTYSLFSARGAAWGPPPPPDHQSLWSGPGPSPLERLLEQQKQSRPPEPQ